MAERRWACSIWRAGLPALVVDAPVILRAH